MKFVLVVTQIDITNFLMTQIEMNFKRSI